MTDVSYTNLRQNLARYLDEAVETRAPITIVRQGGKGDVVLIAADEFAGLQETLHLLSSPPNAQALLKSIDQLNAGQGVERTLIA